jgi:hypothetical protein
LGAVGGIFGEEGIEEREEGERHGRPEACPTIKALTPALSQREREKRRRVVAVGEEFLGEGWAGEKAAAGEEEIERAAEGIDVGAVIDGFGGEGLLGGEEVDGAEDGAGMGEGFFRRGEIGERASEAEVKDF